MSVPAGQFFNIFSKSELNLLSDVLSRLEDQFNKDIDNNDPKFTHAYTNGFMKKDNVYPIIKKMVIERLSALFGKPIDLHIGMYLKEEKPWPIHSDWYKGDQHPDLAILIPLNIQDLDTHTVVFNESYTDRDPNYEKSKQRLESNATDLYNNLCSHETIDRLACVSLLASYPWITGSVIYWDRSLLHSSDNFLSKGIKLKSALVLFTQKDNI